MLIIELLGGVACLLLAAYSCSADHDKKTPDSRRRSLHQRSHPLYRHYNIRQCKDTLRDKRAVDRMFTCRMRK